MESDNLKFGSVAISWFLICIFLNLLYLFYNIKIYNYFQIIIIALDIIIYIWLLLSKRRLAFIFDVVLACILAIILVILTRRVTSVLSCAINPCITYLVIREYWPYMQL